MSVFEIVKQRVGDSKSEIPSNWPMHRQAVHKLIHYLSTWDERGMIVGFDHASLPSRIEVSNFGEFHQMRLDELRFALRMLKGGDEYESGVEAFEFEEGLDGLELIAEKSMSGEELQSQIRLHKNCKKSSVCFSTSNKSFK